ncbi:uncharacterized protein [Miscanthus floridulus]|uniref:uncharacterized protein isoform X3 n=1 Tax=Miscanthus floridulus TaxID=154761 RepID=UPI00345A3DB1
MVTIIRVIVGIIGSAVCIALYAVPMLTFKRVIKEASVGEFSCVPYILALFSTLTYSWYGFPVVSSGWENISVCGTCLIGVLFETSFISLYLWFAPRQKRVVCHANGITGSGNLLRDCIYLKLYSPYPSCAQGICWKYWYSDGHIVLQLSACSCETSYQDKKCGVHAFLLVVVLLLSQLNLDDLWNPWKRSLYHDAKCCRMFHWHSSAGCVRHLQQMQGTYKNTQ